MKGRAVFTFALGLGLATILGLSAVLLMVRPAAADPPPITAQSIGRSGSGGGDFLVSTAESRQYEPAVAYNPDDDEYVVVWGDYQAGGSGNIYGQIYSAQGVPQGGSFPICTATDIQWYPAVAYNPAAGEYLVVWDDRRAGPSDIYGQRVGADGTLLGNADPTVNFAISTAQLNQHDPAVAYNAARDEYLVVWHDERPSAAYDIYGQRVDADGTLLGNADPTVNFAISTASNSQSDPAVAYNPSPTDEYLVVWRDERAVDLVGDIYGQRVDSDGSLLGVNFAISTASNSQEDPAVACNDDAHEYLVVWRDYRANQADIYGQRVDAAGALLGNADPTVNFPISTAPDTQWFPAVAYDAEHGWYLVVWWDKRHQISTGDDVYGQLVQADGTLAAQGNFAISTEIGDQDYPAVAYSTGSHQYLVVWSDERGGENEDRIYGQRVWWPGLLLGHNLTVSEAASQQHPAVAYDSREHRYLAVWADDRNGHYDIYGQLYHVDGYPLGGNFVINGPAGDQIRPAVAYNRDALNYLVVFEGPGGIGGQLVTTQGSTFGGPFFVREEAGAQRPAVAYGYDAEYYLVVFEDPGFADPYIGVSYVSGEGSVFPKSLTIGRAGDEHRSPDLAYNPTDNRSLVVWQGKESGGNWDIYGRQTGGPDDAIGELITVTAAARGQQYPSVVYNPDQHDYLVAWEDYRSTSDFDVYAQKINAADGSLDGGNLGIPAFDGGAANQRFPDVVYADSLDRYRIVWQDDRDTGTLGWDIRGQWLGGDGSYLGTLAAPVRRYWGDQTLPAIAYSEGSTYNKALTVWQDGRTGGTDIYGRFGALDDNPPLARFRRRPVFGQVGEDFAFNAWPSRDDTTPRGDLQVRWDFTSDGSWDVALGTDKYVTQTFTSTGVYTITLEVWDEALLTDTLSLPVYVYSTTQTLYAVSAAQASPPTVTLAVSPTYGVAGTVFSFDGTGSTGVLTLTARWDWEYDGLFDTAFSTELTATHAYTVAGDYTVRLMVRDGSGLSRSALHNITVQAGTPISLAVSPGEVTMTPGEVVGFHATAWDSYDNKMYNPGITWTVATSAAGGIDDSGVFTASLQAGTYANVIQATSDGISDTVTVTIVWPYEVYLPLLLKDQS